MEDLQGDTSVGVESAAIPSSTGDNSSNTKRPLEQRVVTEAESSCASRPTKKAATDPEGKGQPSASPTTDESGAGDAAASASPSMDQILALVQERENARKAKDFTSADSIREQLRAHGVTLFDKQKIWKTQDGRQGDIPTWDSNFQATQPTDPSVSTSLSTSAINVFIQAREIARQQKDWAKADQIREELRQHGISIYDKAGIWKASDGRREQILGSGRGGIAGLPLAQSYGAMVNPLPFQQGYAAMMNPLASHQYGGHAYGAAIQQPYGATGLPDAGISSQSVASQGQRLGEVVGAQNQQRGYIEQIVLHRERARCNRDFVTADTLRQQLRHLGVEVYDKDKLWKQVSTGIQGLIPTFDALRHAGP